MDKLDKMEKKNSKDANMKHYVIKTYRFREDRDQF